MNNEFERKREIEVLNEGKIKIKNINMEVLDKFSLAQEIKRCERTLGQMREEAKRLQEEYDEERKFKEELEEILSTLEEKKEDNKLEFDME